MNTTELAWQIIETNFMNFAKKSMDPEMKKLQMKISLRFMDRKVNEMKKVYNSILVNE